jgi:hypothetical protein
MKKQVRKDQYLRQDYMTYQSHKFILSYSLNNFLLLNSVRVNLSKQMLESPKNSLLIRCVLRCILTGRRKRLNKWFSFSRLVLLRLFRARMLFNWKKSKW